jgi:hypothetical protein
MRFRNAAAEVQTLIIGCGTCRGLDGRFGDLRALHRMLDDHPPVEHHLDGGSLALVESDPGPIRGLVRKSDITRIVIEDHIDCEVLAQMVDPGSPQHARLAKQAVAGMFRPLSKLLSVQLNLWCPMTAEVGQIITNGSTRWVVPRVPEFA